ncbi:MAG: ATP-dependent 6-phosphofructokinase [Verrucomicrobiota bacterium]|nr:ATP-dependent 6-phosphofructokinase [Limisphaera sp.]MDW8382081.1 ATP-dependent 6-phosphofructokinase [Verrucomicrobiota bacterium]
MLTPQDTLIHTLGPAPVPSPLRLWRPGLLGMPVFVSERVRVRFLAECDVDGLPGEEVYFEKAGPREKLFFDPRRTRAAIVTCGGLCPGLNNVIRSAFLELHYNYGVPEVLGIRYGYAGLNPAVAQPPLRLTPDLVDTIHEEGGTILGTSRGPQPVDVMVDYLVAQRIDLLLCVGGDGTLRGARAIAEEVLRRGLKIAVVGVPKTIDNDVMYVEKTFGMQTAVDKAREVLNAAHSEAKSVYNGVGLVKVMGRDAGFIAALATLASQEVNFTLIPEVPLCLDGPKGFLETLRRRLETRHHAVVVVAEGVGRDLLEGEPTEADASGNPRPPDIGPFLKNRILAYLRQLSVPVDVKYFDPSYLIRSVPANSEDAIFCDALARNAVHAGMAGKTNVVVGVWNGVFTHVPIPLAVSGKKQVDPAGALWKSVLACTGQPPAWS